MATRKGSDRPVLDVAGLCEEWDSAEDIRGRLRNGQTFENPEGPNDDVNGCCKHASILSPILTRMATVEGRPLPNLDPLRQEIDKLFIQNKRTGPEEGDQVVKASWRVKKLCGFVKMKVRRGEVSAVS